MVPLVPAGPLHFGKLLGRLGSTHSRPTIGFDCGSYIQRWLHFHVGESEEW